MIRTVAAGSVILASLAGAGTAGLRVNASVSMPIGLWRVARVESTVQVGQVVTICPPDTPAIRDAAIRGYIPAGCCPGGTEPLLKPIGAVAGDIVAVSASGVTVNGLPVPATAQLGQDSAGRVLQGIPAGTYPVQPGDVWLLSGHDPRSFDSRYFGPVPVANVQGVAHPVWVIR